MRREYKVNKYWFSWGYGKSFDLGFYIYKGVVWGGWFRIAYFFITTCSLL